MSVHRYPLTPFQLDEVDGLLGVCRDEAANSGDRTVWGFITWRGGVWQLDVVDPLDAIDDLRYRADYLIEEGGRVLGSNLAGQSGARSLRELAKRIEANLTTAGGTALTDDAVQRLADEAEVGYDIKRLQPQPRTP